jgi:arylsulfatase A-like enzyme
MGCCWLVRGLVLGTALLAVHQPGSNAFNQSNPLNPPNLILIQADDLGYGDLSSYGQVKFSTPHLDRLAREGTRFTQYYAGSTVCAPSRAALMLGLHTGHNWIRGNGEIPLRPSDVTLPEVLKAAAYDTAVVGKWGLGREDTDGRPWAQGVDHFFGVLDHRHAHRQYTTHLWRNQQRVELDLARDYVNDLFTADALDFAGRARTRPFFLYLAYTVPHAELRVPEDSLADYRGRFPETPFVNTEADAYTPVPPFTRTGYRSQPAPRAAFAAMIARMDRDIGRLMAMLAARGLDRNTLVLFTSDNGPHREGGADPDFFDGNGPLRGIKRDLYEGGIRVPMIAWAPGRVPAGRTSDHVWTHWDLLPTLADLAGAAVPIGLDGLSMRAALEGRAAPTHDFLYWEFHERGFQQAVRMGKWKALRLKPGAPLELYDLDADVGEAHDVAATNPDIVAKIERYLQNARSPSERWKVAP